MSEQRYSPYRWVMLALAWLISAFQSWGMMSIAPLGTQLMLDLDMDHAMFMSVVGAPQILGIFLALPAGILADRFGIKRMIILAGIIGGIFGILRGVSDSYIQLFTFSVISGFGQAIIMPNMAKLVRDWFPPHQMGLATGGYVTGGSAGLALGLGLTYPIFGFNWRLSLYSIGAMMLVCVIIWFFLAKEKKVETQKPTIKQDLALVARNRDIWITALMMLFAIGGVINFTRLLPVALQSAWSIEPGLAGAVASVNTIGAFTGNLLMPFLSDRTGHRKPFLIALPALGAISIFLLWNLPFGAFTWIVSYLIGVFLGGFGPMSMVVITEHPDMPSKLLGTAMGFRTTISNSGMYLMGVLGGYIVDWTDGYDVAFLTFAILIFLSFSLGIIVSETGRKAQQKVAAN